MAPATFCISGVPVSERSTSQAKYAATRTAMTPEIGTTHSRGEASNENPPQTIEKLTDKKQAPAPTEGAAALFDQSTESRAMRQTAVSFNSCPHRKHRRARRRPTLQRRPRARTATG